MTPGYQLTRLVWWFRSPVTATAAFGFVGGLIVTGGGAFGFFTYSHDTSRLSSVDALVLFLLGSGVVGFRRARCCGVW